MRILAVETATAVGSVALLENEKVIAELTEPVPQRHLEWLAPTIQSLLAQSGWRPGQVEGVAVSIGPGSFTGLRIGLTTAMIWARAGGVPVVGVSTLAALAVGVEVTGLVCPLLDARRGAVAAALFRRDAGLARIMDDAILPLDQMLSRLPAHDTLTFAGDALSRYQSHLLASRPTAALAPPEQWVPRARAVGRLGWERLSRGERDDPYRLRPVYAHAPAWEDKDSIKG